VLRVTSVALQPYETKLRPAALDELLEFAFHELRHGRFGIVRIFEAFLQFPEAIVNQLEENSLRWASGTVSNGMLGTRTNERASVIPGESVGESEALACDSSNSEQKGATLALKLRACVVARQTSRFYVEGTYASGKFSRVFNNESPRRVWLFVSDMKGSEVAHSIDLFHHMRGRGKS